MWYDENDDLSSKFGKDDESGNLNYIDNIKVIKSLKMADKGIIYNLAHEIYNGMADRITHSPYFFQMLLRPYDNNFYKAYANKYGPGIGRIEMCDHTGTHLDSLNHMAYNNKFFNNIDAFDNTGNPGSDKLGIETTGPVITRGLNIDITELYSTDILDQGHAITISELKEFLDKHDLKIEQGDAVFFYTGVSKLFNNPEKYNKYYDSSPGIGYGLAEYLNGKNISLSGSDTPSSEVIPSEIKNTRLPVHQYLIAKCGIRLIDNIKLYELSSDNVHEFLFVCSPIPFRGATASPVSPLAII